MADKCPKCGEGTEVTRGTDHEGDCIVYSCGTVNDLPKAEIVEGKGCLLEQLAQAQAELRDWQERAEKAAAEIDEWKAASLLIDASGDPDGITPSHLERARSEDAQQIERLRAIVDKLIALRDSACEVMLLLTVHGSSIVPHLEDTDDNPGEALRRCIAETVKIDREWQAIREAAEAAKESSDE